MQVFLARWWWTVLVVLAIIGGVVWLVRRSRARIPDIGRIQLDLDLQWNPDTVAAESLSNVYDYVVRVAETTIGWYRTRRRPKRQLGFSLRLGALVLTVGAGLIPLDSRIPSGWSTVMIAIAGLFISLDVLAGHTSGWVRYMLAEQKVERLKDAFLLEWNALKFAKADVSAMLERARTFLLAVGKIVDDETQEWAAEFQNALKEMEKARRAAAEMERGGSIEVSVKNPKAVTEWILEIDGSQRGRTSGKNLAVTDVAVGIRKLKVYGDDAQGKRFSDEKTVKVDPGATVTKELELT